MTPAPISLLPLLAIATLACATQKKPLTGFDKLPPGAITLDADPGGTVMMWPMFDLPPTPQPFRPRLDGQDLVWMTTEDGFYDYFTWTMQGWTGGWNSWLQGIEPGTHVLELVDGAGQLWGRSGPIAVAAGGTPSNPSGQIAAAIFTHFDGNVSALIVDPAAQDADTTTDEITVTNLFSADAVVERCPVSSDKLGDCTPVGTVAPGADLRTVEKVADVAAADDHQALVIRFATDASQSYRRDLRQGVQTPGFYFGSTCQVEQIVLHAPRMTGYSPAGGSAIGMSSCYGYLNGPM
jgi:hypothetical protein